VENAKFKLVYKLQDPDTALWVRGKNWLEILTGGGTKNRRDYNPNWSVGSALPGENLQQIVARRDKLDSCMKSKGYTAHDYIYCGPVKAPTGLCN